MGRRVAEIGQHAVTHELGDKTLEPRDDSGAGVLIRAQHLAHVLGIDAPRKRRRANQIDEHHRQLAAFGFRRARSGCGLGWGARSRSRRHSRLGQGGNRFEELAPVPNGGDADVFEIVSSQLGQDFGVNPAD
jgi:hypothetical protein